MLQTARKEKIIDILGQKKKCDVGELCEYFGVSLSTIHRDLSELEREGRVKKVHGGVLLNEIDDIEIRNIVRLKTNIELKKKIADKELELVENEDCIFLDNSTTCYYFAKSLSESNFKNLTILTNSYIVPRLFVKNENIQVILTGGLLLKEYGCFVGHCAIRTIREFNGNKFFFSTGAISIEGGLSDTYQPDSLEVKREMLERSKEHICLVDSSKFGRIAQSNDFSLSEVDKIITDSGVSDQIRNDFLRVGKELTIAG